MALTKEAYKKLNDNTNGIRFIRPFSEYTLQEVIEALNELEDLRESNKEMRKLLDEAYSKIPSKNNCAKEDIKKALDGLAQFIIINDNGTDESASAIEWHGILKKALTELEELKRYPTAEEVALIPEANIKLVTCELQLRELKRDVARYFELEGNYQKSLHEYHEMEHIKNKIMKVGNEE